MKNKISIVFYGDSIMDVGRNNEDILDIGTGFPHILLEKINAKYGENNFKFYNLSIGGQEVKDLNFRIKNCLKLNPDIVILLIGINDVWDNQYNQSFGSLIEQERFKKEYSILLETFKNNSVEVIVLDPYVLPYPEKRKKWRKDLNLKLEIIKYLAEKHNYLHIKLDEILNSAIPIGDIEKYTGLDGVHPTDRCNSLLSEIIFNKMVESKILEKYMRAL